MFFQRLFAAAVIAALPLMAGAADSTGKPLIMVVQPINSETVTAANYQPLAEYLSKYTGRQIELRTVGNYHIFWGMSRRKAVGSLFRRFNRPGEASRRTAGPHHP